MIRVLGRSLAPLTAHWPVRGTLLTLIWGSLTGGLGAEPEERGRLREPGDFFVFRVSLLGWCLCTGSTDCADCRERDTTTTNIGIHEPLSQQVCMQSHEISRRSLMIRFSHPRGDQHAFADLESKTRLGSHISTPHTAVQNSQPLGGSGRNACPCCQSGCCHFCPQGC